jgi:hypothetical protein
MLIPHLPTVYTTLTAYYLYVKIHHGYQDWLGEDFSIFAFYAPRLLCHCHHQHLIHLNTHTLVNTIVLSMGVRAVHDIRVTGFFIHSLPTKMFAVPF